LSEADDKPADDKPAGIYGLVLWQTPDNRGLVTALNAPQLTISTENESSPGQHFGSVRKNVGFPRLFEQKN
jgi:hypothetical protein